MGALSMAERSHPTSKVRDRSQEDPMPKGWRPRGVTHIRGQGQRPRVPDCNGTEMAERSYPRPRSGGAAERSYPVSEVRGGGREEIPLAPSPRPGAAGGRSYPMHLRLRPGAVGRRSYPTPLRLRPGAVGGRSYTMPLSLRPVAAGRRRYPSPHARGQGQWPGGPTPRPRSRGCLGSGGPRGAIPR